MEAKEFAAAHGIDLKADSGQRVYINPELNDFMSFHDYEWSRAMFLNARDTILADDFNNLAGYWRRVSEGFRIPELMIFAIRIHRQDVADSFPLAKAHLFKMIRDRLLADMKLTNMSRQELTTLLNKYEEELIVTPELFDERRAFYNLVTHDEWEFKIGLQSLVTGSFIAVYFAYELFANRCYLLLGGKPRQNISKHVIFEEVIGDKAKYQEVWDCPEVNEARKARDALVHHDGRTQEANPQQYEPYYELDGNLILVRADSVTKLYNNLRARADTLCRIVLAKFPK